MIILYLSFYTLNLIIGQNKSITSIKNKEYIMKIGIGSWAAGTIVVTTLMMMVNEIRTYVYICYEPSVYIYIPTTHRMCHSYLGTPAVLYSWCVYYSQYKEALFYDLAQGISVCGNISQSWSANAFQQCRSPSDGRCMGIGGSCLAPATYKCQPLGGIWYRSYNNLCVRYILSNYANVLHIHYSYDLTLEGRTVNKPIGCGILLGANGLNYIDPVYCTHNKGDLYIYASGTSSLRNGAIYTFYVLGGTSDQGILKVNPTLPQMSLSNPIHEGMKITLTVTVSDLQGLTPIFIWKQLSGTQPFPFIEG